MDKKPRKVGKVLFFLVLVIFLTLYISSSFGYYEYRQLKKKVLTEEKIKEFEQDVIEGKNIDINDYLIDTKKDYSNNMSKAGLALSKGIENIFEHLINGFFKVMGKLFGS